MRMIKSKLPVGENLVAHTFTRKVLERLRNWWHQLLQEIVMRQLKQYLASCISWPCAIIYLLKVYSLLSGLGEINTIERRKFNFKRRKFNQMYIFWTLKLPNFHTYLASRVLVGTPLLSTQEYYSSLFICCFNFHFCNEVVSFSFIWFYS